MLLKIKEEAVFRPRHWDTGSLYYAYAADRGYGIRARHARSMIKRSRVQRETNTETNRNKFKNK